MSTPYLTAKAATNLVQLSKEQKSKKLLEGLEATWAAIDKDILESAKIGTNFVEYKWDFYKGRINDIFPSLTTELYTYDGGEGTDDTITEAGTMMKQHFEELGFGVGLYTGNLVISWPKE